MDIYANPEKLKELKQRANSLPTNPGVYIMKDKTGKIIYVGKAKALKNRVTQYFGNGNQHTEKVKQMVCKVDTFEYIICDSEFEALILENSLIKQNQPKYNILLKDDKGYHYIKITNDKWKKIETSKMTDKSGEYIGPYNSAYIVNETVDEARKIFKLPDCNRNFDIKTKPCLNFHIGLCDAPCRGNISLAQYLDGVNSAIDFIKGGSESLKTINLLNEKMEQAAQHLDFEYAARLRDRIKALNKSKERQKVVMSTYKSQDVISSALIGENACVEVFLFRNNKLSDKEHFFIDGIADKKSLYSEFLQRYYENKTDIPSRILIDCELDDSMVLEQWLTEKTTHQVNFIIPKVGEQKQLMDMCLNNAADNLSQKTERTGKEMSALNELSSLLGLDKPPRYIESYDISNTAGSENVAGMIVFKDGRPYKPDYKKFKIRSFSGQDDYKSMAEVFERRFSRYNAQDEGFSTLPDLILLDGGKGQLSAVMPILKKHSIDVPIFGMVKDSRHKTRAIAAGGGDIAIKSTRKAYTLITNIQDEVHRFAIGFHKQRQSSNMLVSELLSINSVGKARAKELLTHFKTITRIKSASLEELSSVKGISENCAKEIYKYFNQNNF